MRKQYKKKRNVFNCRQNLPKLCKEDSHDFGHVDVDVNGENNIWFIKTIYIIDLMT